MRTLPPERLEEPGARHLERLEHHVAVRQDRHLAPAARVLDRVERGREEAVRERVVEQEEGHVEEVRAVDVFHPEALQRAQVVRVAQLDAQLLEQLPVALVLPVADLLRQVAAHVGHHVIVVDQRVVDVEEGDHPVARHRGP